MNAFQNDFLQLSNICKPFEWPLIFRTQMFGSSDLVYAVLYSILTESMLTIEVYNKLMISVQFEIIETLLYMLLVLI